MDWLINWVTNPFFYVPLAGWFVAQFTKAVINLIVTKKWEFERLFGDGGMPSGHSATVTALATTCGLHLGTESPVFAIAMIVAIITCHDAMGVRQEAGKHALLLSEIIHSFDDIVKEKIPEVKLKMFVGHTLVQVFAGILIGLFIAFGLYWLVYD